MTSRQPPLVTFIVPLFNGKKFVIETLQSALMQSYANIEVVVVDDGSTDGSVDHIRSKIGDHRVTVVQMGHHGIAGTRNVGLQHSSHSSVFSIFLDQDDLLDPNMVGRLVATLESRPDAVGAYAVADYIDGAGRPYHKGYFAAEMRTRRAVRDGGLRRLSPNEDVTLDELFVRNHVYPPSCVLLRTAQVLQVGGCDESYRVADDWDLMVRVLRAGPMIPVDEVLVGYRQHGSNASGNLARNIRETRMVWANTYFSHLNSKLQKRCLRSAWRAQQKRRAIDKFQETRELVQQRRLSAAVGRALDAAAHLFLVTPLPWWCSPGAGVKAPVRTPLTRTGEPL